MAVLISLETHIEGEIIHFDIVREDSSLLAESILKIIVVELILEWITNRASRIGGSSYPEYATLLRPLVIYPFLDIKHVYYVSELVACVTGAVSSRVKSTASVKCIAMCNYSRTLYID